MESSAAYFREKAAQCRRLADCISNQADFAVLALRKMADEFDAKARVAETPDGNGAMNASYDDEAVRLQ